MDPIPDNSDIQGTLLERDPKMTERRENQWNSVKEKSKTRRGNFFRNAL